MKIIKKLTSLIIPLLLITTIVFTLSSCGNTSKTIRGAYGENFEMYIQDNKSKQLTDDIAKCSVKAKLKKENDITNKNDYGYNKGFNRYSYSVTINGTVDAKYAGREVILYIVFIPDYHLAISGSNIAKGMVSENGTFNYSYTFNSNAILTEWVPYRVDLL